MEKRKVSKISVVVPVYNEEKNIKSFYGELVSALHSLRKKYEIIFVDDGSQDSSFEILKGIYKKDKRVHVISLLGNHGQTLALSEGFKTASGDVILAMDGDGQHDPKYIPEFASAIEEGYDMASSYKERDEGRNKLDQMFSKAAHKVIAAVSGSNMRYAGATMKAYTKEILKKLELTGDMHRFTGALLYFKGIKVKEIPITIRQRTKGKSHYSILKVLKVALDLILLKFLIKYAKTPFRFFGFCGATVSFVGFLGILYVFFEKYVMDVSTASNTSILVVSSMLVLIGVQFIFFGLIAEL